MTAEKEKLMTEQGDPNHWHVFPLDDLIGHDTANKEDCICGPEIMIERTLGGDKWIYVHHSLDGREKEE